MIRSIKVLFLIIICFFSSNVVYATHLRAADIIAKRISQFTYEFTLTVYTDAENVTDNPNCTSCPDMRNLANAQSPIELEVSDGSKINFGPRKQLQYIGNSTYMNVYVVSYTFPSSGNFFVSYTGQNRNYGIVNVGSSPNKSGDYPLYVETFVSISAFSPLNSTPIMTVPPIDNANVGQIYTHNPGAYDPDGDSLSYKPLIPKQGKNMVVPDYKQVNDPGFGAGVTYSIDPITGTITWDAPLTPGEYNIAFMVEEWRNGARIGYVVRDMQIIVLDADLTNPILEVPADTCVLGNRTLTDFVYGYDPNFKKVTLSYFSGPKELGATMIITKPTDYSVFGEVTWKNTCQDIREQPYQAVFKLENGSLSRLAVLKTWQIRLIGPPIQNIKASTTANIATINWDVYECSSQLEKIEVYRRDCDTLNLFLDTCEAGVPTSWGFSLIGSVSGNATIYEDNNGGRGLKTGVDYYYVVLPVYKKPTGGRALPSSVVRTRLKITAPLITQVSVEQTSTTVGKIFVEWQKPVEWDLNLNPGPFKYTLLRDVGSTGTTFTGIPIYTINASVLKNEFFIDSLINTASTGYRYQVLIEDLKTAFKSTSDVVSSVYLDGTAKSEKIDLFWKYTNNWYYPDSLKSYVWQSNISPKKLIDSVNTTSGVYTVMSLTNNNEYCYYLESTHIYCTDTLNNKVYKNLSNIVCKTPFDNTPPCPPILSVAELNCDTLTNRSPIQNSLTWVDAVGPTCDDNIVSYTLYYKPTLDVPEVEIASTLVPIRSFIHRDLESYAGCYTVMATDKFGRNSEMSNQVCVENCYQIELPNLFTPNGDGKNDLFVPMPKTRFVKSIRFSVYNRWGKMVYYSDSNPNIQWNGTDNEGYAVADGVYYYSAEVVFFKTDSEAAPLQLKGWIQLIR